MSEYQGLSYKTFGGADPREKSRVYYCAHEADFERFFTPITEEIFKCARTAAIWYHEPGQQITDMDAFYADLAQMQLFVVPITAHFLFQENMARQQEFQFAAEHHIPILPLMQEPGLERDFNRICGDLQFLDKSALDEDPTAISYEEKLKKYLESVLVSNEMAQRIREAFDAYIFLSYRKKDRAYAQKIMRLIHENPYCRDIAIWYDEFLTPGENFNEAIAEAMQKSKLFALVVTPRLLEIPNYVMDIEYPEAKACGMPILPIQAQETDSEILMQLFAGIDPSLPPEQAALQVREKMQHIALLEHSQDPTHNFLIGLAYLSGIDVEVDFEKAYGLIQAAAEAGLPEAMEKLVSMYQNGEGVPRNYQAAVAWQRRLADRLRQEAAAEPTEAHLDQSTRAFWDLGDMETDLGDLTAARRTFEQLIDCAHEEENHGYPKAQRHLTNGYYKIARVCLKAGQIEEAKRWSLASIRLMEKILAEDKNASTSRNLSITCRQMGDLERREGHIEEAVSWYRRSLEILEDLRQENGMEYVRNSMAESHIALGRLYIGERNFPEAKGHLLQAFSIKETIAAETGDRGILTGIVEQLGKLAEEQEDYTEAGKWYDLLIGITEKQAAETETLTAQMDLASSYVRRGDLDRKSNDLADADQRYQQALKILEPISDATEESAMQQTLVGLYSRLSDNQEKRGLMSEANAWNQKLISIAKRLSASSDQIEAQMDLAFGYVKAGEYCENDNDYAEAAQWYAQAVAIDEAIAQRAKTFLSYENLLIDYQKMIDLSVLQDQWTEVERWARKEKTLSEEAEYPELKKYADHADGWLWQIEQLKDESEE